MTARLALKSGRAALRELRLGGARRIVVGSSSVCDWRIVSSGVRARHATLAWDGERLLFESMDAFGATWVDRRPISEGFTLRSNALVQFGSALVAADFPQEDPAELPSPGRAESPTMIDPRVSTRPSRSRRARAARVCAALVLVGCAAVLLLAWRRSPRSAGKTPGDGNDAAPRLDVNPPVEDPEGVQEAFRVAPTPSNLAPPEVRLDTAADLAAAAALLASGREEDARDAYARIAATRPAEPVFAVVAHLLTERTKNRGGRR